MAFRFVFLFVGLLGLSGCAQPTATPQGVAKVQASGQGAVGYWTKIQGRDCIEPRSILVNVDTKEEVTYRIGGRFSEKSTVSSRLNGIDTVMQDISFLSVKPGRYTIKRVHCSTKRANFVHSEESVVDDASKRLIFDVRPGEIVDFGVLQIETANVAGSNAIVVLNSSAVLVPKPSSAKRLEAIKEVLGSQATTIVSRLPVRGQSK